MYLKSDSLLLLVDFDFFLENFTKLGIEIYHLDSARHFSTS